MAGKVYYYVGWNAALAIWWEQIWRVLLANALFYGFQKLMMFLTPLIYMSIRDALKYDEKTTFSLIVTAEMLVFLWAGRQSLMDRYSGFRLVVENKQTKLSAFGLDKRLRWPIYLRIWWSQIWRMLLVPGTVIAGSLAALMANHPHAANYSHMLPPALLNISLYAVFVLSLWATRESLGDRYKRFRVVAEPKTLYRDGSMT